VTANQVVAYNLKRAREGLNLTQELAAQKLGDYLGRRWSKASFSATERSAEGGRIRVFDANELLAFSRVFEQSIGWFFTPPAGVDEVECGPREDVSRVVGRDELRDSALSSGLATLGWATQLESIAAELRAEDDSLLQQHAKEDSDGN
jgi:transcriptional regulator with XRE-family HTH domain